MDKQVPLSPQDWHQRFLVQASWSSGLRSYFFQSLQNEPCSRVLDIGCGTGALLRDLYHQTGAQIFGADLNLTFLNHEADRGPDIHLSGADVHHLPFPDDSFDLVVCHYFLLWTGVPQNALNEIKRVTRPGGFVAAFAEPDYGGRIDFPVEFSLLADLQINALLQAGADPLLGRKLKSLFLNAELIDLEWGVYQAAWKNKLSPEEIESEWMVLRDDLSGQLAKAEIDALEKHDRKTRESGSRIAYVPTFYCWGKVP